MKLSTRLAIAGFTSAVTLVAAPTLAATDYIDPHTGAAVTPGTYDFSVEQPPCFLDDYTLRVTGLSLENAQRMIDKPQNYTGTPWCDPLKGVYIQSDWDKNRNGIIDTLETGGTNGAGETASPTPSPSASPTPSGSPSPSPSPSASPSPSPAPSPDSDPQVLGAQTSRTPDPSASPSPSPSASPSASPAGRVLGASVLPGVGSVDNALVLALTLCISIAVASIFYRRSRSRL